LAVLKVLSETAINPTEPPIKIIPNAIANKASRRDWAFK